VTPDYGPLFGLGVAVGILIATVIVWVFGVLL
jgi:hypothetical protein